MKLTIICSVIYTFGGQGLMQRARPPPPPNILRLIVGPNFGRLIIDEYETISGEKLQTPFVQQEAVIYRYVWHF